MTANLMLASLCLSGVPSDSLAEHGQLLREVRVDVLLACGAQIGTGQCGQADQARRVAAHAGLDHVTYGAAGVLDGGLTGNAVAARRPLAAPLTIPLDVDGARGAEKNPARGVGQSALVTRLRLPGQPDVSVIAANLHGSIVARAGAARTLLTVVDRLPVLYGPALPGPVVLSVDLGDVEADDPATRILTARLTGLRPGADIGGRLLLGEHVTVLDAGTLQSATGPVAWSRVRAR
jgi:hypothetical protein